MRRYSKYSIPPDTQTHSLVTHSMIGAQVRSAQLDVLEQEGSSSSSTESSGGISVTLLRPANNLDDPTPLCHTHDDRSEDSAPNLSSISGGNADRDKKKSISSLTVELIRMIQCKIGDITHLEASGLAECLECLIDNDTLIRSHYDQQVTIIRRNREFSRGESWFHLQWQSENRKISCEIRIQPGSEKCMIDNLVM